jgi:uncharacterized BrkB/YihY/UPF0761 family membrane protein
MPTSVKEEIAMGEGESDDVQPQIGKEAVSQGSGVPVVGAFVDRTSRFSREVVATMISLASAAFGVVAALAWNTAITTWFNNVFKETNAAKVSVLFVYAVVATLVGVVVIVLLGRLAARINAQPVEFKYPVVPKS